MKLFAWNAFRESALSGVLALSIGLLCFTQATPAGAQAGEIQIPTGEAPTNPNLPLQPGYVVNISVEGESEPTGNYMVDTAGNLGIRYNNVMTPVQVKGMTAAQVQVAVTRVLASFIKKPQVTVKLIQVPRPTVFVTGSVKNPGAMTVPTGTTVADVLTRAEWTPDADLAHVRLMPAPVGTEKPKAILIPFDRFVTGNSQQADDTANIVLKNGDRLFVPPKTLPGGTTISISGEVEKPNLSLPMRVDPPETLRDALYLVGNVGVNANRKAITIRREGMEQPFVVDWDKAQAGDPVNNIELKPNDSIFVPRLPANDFLNLNGAFFKPGKIVYDKPITLLQAINEGGGITPGAKGDGLITRSTPGAQGPTTRQIKFKWKELEQGKAPDVPLQPGDTVWIEPGIPKPPMDPLALIGAIGSIAYLFSVLK